MRIPAQPTAVARPGPMLKRVLGSPVFIVAVAFAFRMLLLYYGELLAPVPIRNTLPNANELERIARAIAAGRGFSSPLNGMDTGPTAWFTPIYPYLVAAIFRVWGISTATSRIVLETLNCAFVSLTIIPIFEIARRSFGRGTAVAAAASWIILPTALMFSLRWIWDTALSALLLALIFWATLALFDSERTAAWVGYGGLWAVAGLTNPALLSVLPFLLAWLVHRRQGIRTSRLKLAGATLLVFLAGVAPWMVRNYAVFGKFIPLRSNFGLELWLGNNPTVSDTWTPWMHPNDDPEEAEKFRRLGEISYMEEKQHAAIEFIRTHPGDTLNFIFHRFVNNWLAVSDNPFVAWSHQPLSATLVSNFLLTLLSLCGVLFAYRARRPDAAPYALVLLVFPLIFYLTHSSLRYRFPMDPILIVLAVNGIAYPLSQLRKRSSKLETATPLHPISGN
jgi:4-amino-4-deoxy-L-arabinose transferase-like glycosyltransferase